MEEQGIVRLGAPDEPRGSLQDVVFRGDHPGILLVVGQDDHVLALVAVALDQEGGDVLDVVDAAAQLALLAEVVDADQQRLALPRAVRVLEGVALRGPVAELLGRRRRRRSRPVRASVSAVSRLVASMFATATVG